MFSGPNYVHLCPVCNSNVSGHCGRGINVLDQRNETEMVANNLQTRKNNFNLDFDLFRFCSLVTEDVNSKFNVF